MIRTADGSGACLPAFSPLAIVPLSAGSRQRPQAVIPYPSESSPTSPARCPGLLLDSVGIGSASSGTTLPMGDTASDLLGGSEIHVILNRLSLGLPGDLQNVRPPDRTTTRSAAQGGSEIHVIRCRFVSLVPGRASSGGPLPDRAPAHLQGLSPRGVSPTLCRIE